LPYVQYTPNLRNFNGVEAAEIFNHTTRLSNPALSPKARRHDSVTYSPLQPVVSWGAACGTRTTASTWGDFFLDSEHLFTIQ